MSNYFSFRYLIWCDADIHHFCLDLHFISVDRYRTDIDWRSVWVDVQSPECLCTPNSICTGDLQDTRAISATLYQAKVIMRWVTVFTKLNYLYT